MSRFWISAALALASALPAATAQQRVAIFPTSFTIFFQPQASALTPEAMVVLDAIADKATGDRRLMVLIDAYATGADARRSSEARGNAVRRYLLTKGISSAVITVTPNISDTDAVHGPDRAEIRLSRMS